MHVVCCLGLGDSPKTLGELPDVLERAGYNVHICTNYTTCFEDRVQSVLRVVESLNVPSTEVTLVGMSAGGLAVLVAATRVKVRCVFAFVPAPPRGISPLWNPWLLRCLWRYLPDMLRGKPFRPRYKDYCMIALNGLSQEEQKVMLQAMRPISGREANELASPLLQPQFDYAALRYCPIYTCGALWDRWVPCRIVRTLVERLKAAKCTVEHTEIEAPHALLRSNPAPDLIRWVAARIVQQVSHG